jgi:uncharacterized protein
MAYLIAPPVGVLVGLLLGMLGGGGAILAVPALVYLMGQSPKAATLGSLVIVAVSAPAALIGHWRAGRVRVGAGMAFAAAGLIGSYLGSQVSLSANPNVLLLAFAALMVVIAAVMTWRLRRTSQPATAVAVSRATVPAATVAGSSGGSEIGAAGDPGAGGGNPGGSGHDSPAVGNTARRTRQLALIAATATGIGFLTGLFGVGGGIIVVPTLVLALGFEMPIAVGTSLVVIIINSLAAIATRLGSHVTVDWLLIAAFTASAIVGAIVGNRIASRVNTRRLTQAFIALIVVVAAYTASRSLVQLT